MSEEKWFQPLKPWMTFLKLRASLGLVGNDKPSDLNLRFLYLADPYEVNNAVCLTVTADTDTALVLKTVQSVWEQEKPPRTMPMWVGKQP